MQHLLDGYARFRTSAWPGRRALFEHLAAQGQRPRTLVIACSDSRVDPAMIFDAGPGELFVVRNVANLVPPYQPDGRYHGTSAALEFGVRVLQVQHLVVLGHGRCGGIEALLRGAPDSAQDFVAPWMGIAAPARARALQCDTPEAQQQCCEYEAVKLSLANLMTFPWIAERVGNGALHLHGAWFAVHTGVLDLLQPDGSFRRAA